MIIIIGGGIVGLSLAYELLKQGQDVTLIEAQNIASGASGVATSYLEPRLGHTKMRALEWHSFHQWPAYNAEIEAVSGQNTFFKADGQLRVSSEQYQPQFEKELAARKAQNHAFERLSIEDARKLEPSLSERIVACAHLPQVYRVTGKALCHALAHAIKAKGGLLIENCPIDHLESPIHQPNTQTVFSKGQAIAQGEKIVLCNGLGTKDITDLPKDIPISRGVRGVNLILDMAPMPQPVRHLIKHHRGNLCPRENNQLIVGTTYEADELSLTPDATVIETLYQNGEPIIPMIRKLPLLKVTAGLRTKVGDGELRLGRSALNPHIYYSLSHGGAGFLRAPVVANELATFIATGNKGALTGFITHN